jgi:2-amino-4-hydroxy-6-hydroxymethyldihydropteridine diphosphokinase
VRVFLGLGSNLGDREGALARAVSSLPDVVAVSSVYQTEPVGGPAGQGPFLNLVVELDTELDARQLLELARRLEGAADRTREVRWGPRTLDVDVLLVGGEVVDDVDLVVPHPRMWERRFVVEPLYELAPELVPADVREGAGGAVEVVGRLAGY